MSWQTERKVYATAAQASLTSDQQVQTRFFDYSNFTKTKPKPTPAKVQTSSSAYGAGVVSVPKKPVVPISPAKPTPAKPATVVAPAAKPASVQPSQSYATLTAYGTGTTGAKISNLQTQAQLPQTQAQSSLVKPAPTIQQPPVTYGPGADPYSLLANMHSSGPAPRCAITKAVFIGINYIGQAGVELKGCINDVANSLAKLKQLGFEGKDETNMRIITDKTRRKPNRAELLDAMKWLVNGAKAGDVLWFHFSGHGSQMKADATVEKDGMDETIVPLDYRRAGQIPDDLMYQVLVKPLPKDVTLYAIFDCCHSGTVLDMKYVYDDATNEWLDDEDIRARTDAEGTAVMLSGCLSAQTSADLPPGFQGLKADSVGAMTSSYLPLTDKSLSWTSFVQSLRTNLTKSKLSQVPQLEMSRPIDLRETAFGKAFPALAQPVPQGKGASAPSGFVAPVSEERTNNRLKRLRRRRRRVDENGNPIPWQPRLDKDGNPIQRKQGQERQDEKGNPVHNERNDRPYRPDTEKQDRGTGARVHWDNSVESLKQGASPSYSPTKATVEETFMQPRGHVRGFYATRDMGAISGLAAAGGATLGGLKAVPLDVQQQRRTYRP